MSHQPTPEVVTAAQLGTVKWGVPAPVTLAQWALESNWGTHMPPGSNNPFGIKARLNNAGVAIDPFVMADTTESLQGRTIHTTAPFRRFSSITEAFDYHDELIATGHCYVHAMAFKNSPDSFAHCLTGVYATDPQYGDKLVRIMKGSDLYKYMVKASA